MSAYLTTLIYGNEDFGGYFSVDGSETIAVQHDMTYELDPGPHHIEIFSNSNAQRTAGKLQTALYFNTSSSGALLDALERKQMLKNLGDSWEIDVFVEDSQMLELAIRSDGNQIVGNPYYSVEDLSDEECEALEEIFEEVAAEEEAERKRPKRSPKKIVWGSILLFIGLVFVMVTLNDTEAAIAEYGLPALLVGMIGFLLGGFLLFFSGIRKKPRG